MFIKLQDAASDEIIRVPKDSIETYHNDENGRAVIKLTLNVEESAEDLDQVFGKSSNSEIDRNGDKICPYGDGNGPLPDESTS